MDKKVEWFVNAHYGMFIHWGLYSAAGGRWKGMEVPWVSEWMMRKFRIPRLEYRKELATYFNPVKFDARRWLESAAKAGMKYMTVTAKHHDGFAMFRSTWSDYNIVDATPFKRDPLAELAEAAPEFGIRLGFYYSHEQDWYEKGATGNTWDFSHEEKSEEAFEEYLQTKVRHQVRELLTNYGDVACIWFDTPGRITPRQSKELKQLVQNLAPNCLINSRLGGAGEWDYDSLGDNQLPAERFNAPTEGLGTMNESWGYKSDDHGYRSVEDVLRIMARLSACGANYLLNVGPTGEGEFPPEAEKILRGTGEFLRVNGEALYGSRRSPVNNRDNRWGDVSAKANALYFWCISNPGELHFFGVRNRVKKVSILGGAEIPFSQDDNDSYDYHRLVMQIPADYPAPFVVKAETEGDLDCNEFTYTPGEYPEVGW